MLLAGLQLHDPIAEGRSGVVYRATDENGRAVAVKLLRDRTPRELSRLKAEFRALSGVAHRNVVQHYDLRVEGGEAAIVMELLDNVDLSARCRTGATVDLATTRRVFRGLASGLAALHQAGVLHRDIAPRNICFDSEGLPKWIDLSLGAARKAAAHAPAGSLMAMAPEAIMGRASTRSDWFSLGVLLFQVLQGEDPYDASLAQGLVEKSQGRISNAEGLGEHGDLGDVALAWLQANPNRRPGAEALCPDTPAPPPERFFGREDERARLRPLLRANGFCWAVVRGPSGIGKSRLLEELTSDTPEALTSRCHPRESVQLNAFDPIVDALVSSSAPMPPMREDALAALATLFPVVADVVGDRPGIPAADPASMRADAFSAWMSWVEHRAGPRQRLVWIDDAQWMDEDSIDLIRALLAARPAMSLVLSARDEIGERFAKLLEDHEPDHDVRLGPLSSSALSELVRSSAPEVDVNAAEALAEQSGGNPFLAHDLALRSVGADAESRLRDLGDSAQDTFRLVALAGRPLETSVLTAAHGSEAMHWVARLRASRLLRPLDRGDEGLLPYHDRLAKRALEAMGDEVTADAHARLLSGYEAAGDPDPEHLLPHMRAIGDPRVRATAVEAATRASTRMAFQRAATLFELADASAPGEPSQEPSAAWVAERVAQCRARLGEAPTSARWFQRAAEQLGPVDRFARLRVCARRAEVLLGHGHVKEGTHALESLLSDVGVDMPPDGARSILALLWERARLSLVRTRNRVDSTPEQKARLDALLSGGTALALVSPIQATVLATRLLREARESGPGRALVVALCTEASMAANLGGENEHRRAAAVLSEAKTMAGTPFEQVWTHATQGTLALCLGRPAGALSHYRRSLAIVEENTWDENGILPRDIVRTYVFAYPAQAYAGELDSLAELLLARSEDASERYDLLHSEACSHGQVSLAWLVAGDAHAALSRSERALAAWPTDRFGIAHYHHLLSQAYVAPLLGRLDSAWEVFEAMWPEARRAQFLRMEMLRTELWNARGCVAAWRALEWGRREDVREVERAIRHLEATRIGYSRPFASGLRAALHRVRGESASVRQALEDSADGYRDAGMSAHAAVAGRASAGRPLERYRKIARSVLPGVL